MLEQTFSKTPVDEDLNDDNVDIRNINNSPELSLGDNPSELERVELPK